MSDNRGYDMLAPTRPKKARAVSSRHLAIVTQTSRLSDAFGTRGSQLCGPRRTRTNRSRTSCGPT